MQFSASMVLSQGCPRADGYKSLEQPQGWNEWVLVSHEACGALSRGERIIHSWLHTLTAMPLSPTSSSVHWGRQRLLNHVLRSRGRVGVQVTVPIVTLWLLKPCSALHPSLFSLSPSLPSVFSAIFLFLPQLFSLLFKFPLFSLLLFVSPRPLFSSFLHVPFPLLPLSSLTNSTDTHTPKYEFLRTKNSDSQKMLW